MTVRKLLLVAGTVLTLLVAVAPAAHAGDYPPTTAIRPAGSTASTTIAPTSGSIGLPTTVAPTTSGLPFTGGNSGALAWLAVALIGSGTFLALTLRRLADLAARTKSS